jgi:hypothetical protein
MREAFSGRKAMSSSPLDLQIPAHYTVTAHAGQTVNVPMVVSNLGTEKLTVFASMLKIVHGWHVSLSRTRFHLAPGHSRTDVLRFIIPKGASGDPALHVKFSAAPLAHGGGIRTAGGVANTIAIHLPALPPAAHSFPLVPVIVGLLLVLSVITGAVIWHRLARGLDAQDAASVRLVGHPDREAVERVAG